MLHVVPHSVPTRRSSGLRPLLLLAQIGAVLFAQGLGGEAITIHRISTDHTLHILPVARAIVEAEIAVGAAHHDRATVGATDEDFALRFEIDLAFPVQIGCGADARSDNIPEFRFTEYGRAACRERVGKYV